MMYQITRTIAMSPKKPPMVPPRMIERLLLEALVLFAKVVGVEVSVGLIVFATKRDEGGGVDVITVNEVDTSPFESVVGICPVITVGGGVKVLKNEETAKDEEDDELSDCWVELIRALDGETSVEKDELGGRDELARQLANNVSVGCESAITDVTTTGTVLVVMVPTDGR